MFPMTSALVALVTMVALVTPAPPCPEGCSCGGIGLTELTCGGRIYRVRDDGYAEADCQGFPLECRLLPPLPRPSPLRRLELTNCSLPRGAAACLVRALHSPPPEVLMTMDLVEGVGEGTFEGLGGVQEVYMMNAASQRTVPPLSPPLAPLRLRVVGGTNVTLPPTPLPPSLQSLEVSNSGVRSLTPAAFRGLNDLETLRVWGNDIEEISEEVFEYLPSLRTLSLSRNPLKRLRLSAAKKLQSLTALRVDIDTLMEGDLSGLTELKELTLESTLPLVFSPRSLSSLPSLASLSVTHSGVTSLPPSLLTGSDALVNVTFKWNHIQTISEDVFKNKSMLERLDLSHNKISSISQQMFLDLVSLKTLDLDYNMITALPDRALSPLPLLSSLSLSHNLLTSLPSTALPPSTLHTLRLSHNLLSYSPPTQPDYGEYFDLGIQSPFNSLLELEVLDLSYNNISYIFSDWRIVLIHRLKLLDLSHNAFTEINSGDLQFLQTELTVDLTYNNITSVMPPSTPPPPTRTFLLGHNPYTCDCNMYPLLSSTPSPSSYHLDEARCSLPPLLAGSLLPAVNVDVLTCPLPDIPLPSTCVFRPHRNRLECEASSVLSPLPDPRLYGLPDLYLKLTSMTSDVNVNLSVLPAFVTQLNMSTLDIGYIDNIPDTVTLVDLTYNKLTRVPRGLVEGGSNRTLLLQGNPLACDCWHRDDVTLLQVLQRQRGNIGDFEYVECTGGGRVGGVDASALCDVQRAAVVGSVLAVLGIMLAVVLTLTWRYSVEIRLYLAARLPGLEFLLDEEVWDESKVYDVFVSFSHEDFPWVRDELMPVLDLEYKVCVHYREWEVGRPIPVQIQRSVEQSRRTVVVLSRSFVRSTWAVEEFRAACAASARDNTTRAVVIMLEQVALDSLHPDLRDYLSLTTYLEAHDPKFWDKLRRALPRRPRRPLPAPPGGPLPAPTTTSVGRKLPSIFTAIKNRFKQPSVMDLPDPVKVRSDPVKVRSDPVKVGSDPKGLDVILDQNGQLVNRGYVKDV